MGHVPNSPTEWIIILVVVLLLFGGAQLPKLARNLGQAQKEFKKGLNDGLKDDDSPSKDSGSKDSGSKDSAKSDDKK